MSREIRDQARLWTPEAADGISLFKAHFETFSYTRHIHEEYAIGVIESGTQYFHHKGSAYHAPPGTIITVNPDEVHDGKAATAEGYEYRMIYVEPSLVSEILHDYSGITGERFFSTPATWDAELSTALISALHAADSDTGTLEVQDLLYGSIAALFERHGSHHDPGKFSRSTHMADHAVAYIRAHADEDIHLEDIAESVGLSRFHFLRAFKETTGFSPHFFLKQQRLLIAKSAIEEGVSLSDAANLAGFSDQSHLNRTFKSAFGLTPGMYRNQFTNR